MSDREVVNWETAKLALLEELFLIADWHTKLAECHLKCSSHSGIGNVALDLWVFLNENEVKGLYELAKRRTSG